MPLHQLVLTAAASLSLNVSPPPVLGGTSTVTATVATDRGDVDLTILYRPGKPCAAKVDDDYEVAGGTTGNFVGSKRDVRSGTYTFTVPRWEKAEKVHLCAWIDRNFEETLAQADVPLDVRSPSADAALSVSGERAYLDNDDRLVSRAALRVRGSIGGSGSLDGGFVPASRPCTKRTVGDTGAGHVSFARGIEGAFDETSDLAVELRPGTRYRACALVLDDAYAVTAVRERTYVPRARPFSSSRRTPYLTGPGIGTVYGRPRVGQVLRCHTGRWLAFPRRISYAYRWRRNFRVIAGAKGSAYRLRAADRNRKLDCVVTARNAAGRGRATAPYQYTAR